jgi:hypothetical protein
MRSRRWRGIQSGLPESAHGSPELVKHASLVQVDGMSRNTAAAPAESSAASAAPGRPVVLGKVLRYRQLGGGYSLLPPARSLVERSCGSGGCGGVALAPAVRPARSHSEVPWSGRLVRRLVGVS